MQKKYALESPFCISFFMNSKHSSTCKMNRATTDRPASPLPLAYDAVKNFYTGLAGISFMMLRYDSSASRSSNGQAGSILLSGLSVR